MFIVLLCCCVFPRVAYDALRGPRYRDSGCVTLPLPPFSMLRSMQKLMRTIAAYFCSKLKRNAQGVRPHYAIQHWNGGWGLVFQRVSSKIVGLISFNNQSTVLTLSSPKLEQIWHRPSRKAWLPTMASTVKNGTDRLRKGN